MFSFVRSFVRFCIFVLLRFLSVIAPDSGSSCDDPLGLSEAGSSFRPPRYRNGVDGVDSSVSTSVKCVDAISFNAYVEPLAVAFAVDFVRRRGEVRLGDLQAEVAMRFDVSLETAKRYILKHGATVGEFVISRGVVSLR